MGYKFTKKIQAGTALIIGGFLFTLGQDLYNAGKEAVFSLPLQLVVPAVLGVAGFGIILYDVWSRRKQQGIKEDHKQALFEEFKREQTRKELRRIDEDIQDPKAKSERDGKWRPSNIT